MLRGAQVNRVIAYLTHPISATVLSALLDGAHMCEVDVDADGIMVITEVED